MGTPVPMDGLFTFLLCRGSALGVLCLQQPQQLDFHLQLGELVAHGLIRCSAIWTTSTAPPGGAGLSDPPGEKEKRHAARVSFLIGGGELHLMLSVFRILPGALLPETAVLHRERKKQYNNRNHL